MGKGDETLNLKIDKKTVKLVLYIVCGGSLTGGGGYIGWDKFWAPYIFEKEKEIHEHKAEMKMTRQAIERIEYAQWIENYLMAGYTLDSAIEQVNEDFHGE